MFVKRGRLAYVCSLLALGCLAMPALAQRTVAEQAADSQFVQRRWSEAAAAYKALTAANPLAGLNWVNLGESELQLGRFDDALAAFGRAVDLKFRPFRSIVDQARAAAVKGDEARTFNLLQKVVDGGAGGALKAYIVGAPEFRALIAGARFTAFAAQLKACTTAPYRQFDFWVGDWEVHGAAGGVAGHNVVTLEQDGCIVVEHWTSQGGGQTGTSFNYYDVRDTKWHQLYLDNSGNAGAFPAMSGMFADGRMVLLTEDVNNTLSRWTWFVIEPGKVKQMAELSTDHGKTWQVTWNSVYIKKH